jgi:hypothetical protein
MNARSETTTPRGQRGRGVTAPVSPYTLRTVRLPENFMGKKNVKITRLVGGVPQIAHPDDPTAYELREVGEVSLTLRSLPSLLTDCVIVGHACKADMVFTLRQFFALCIHMLNENPPNFFLIPYRNENDQAQYKKAFRANATKRIAWTWDTITGRAKRPGSIGFYANNSERKTRWAAMDFDAHDGDFMRARDLALKAFGVLYRQPQVFVCLTTSAGDPERSGFHLFVFSRQLYPCENWTRLLKQVCAQIGAEIRPGIVEIFPDEFRGIGKALRAPGSFNPKTGDCGLILHESLTQSFLPSLPYGRERDSNALYVLCELPRVKGASSQSSGFFRGEQGEWQKQFAITAPSTRHKRLTELVGTGLFQAGREVVRKNAEIQYREATPTPKASEREPLEEFDKAWFGWEWNWFAGLSAAERQKYEALTTQHEREGFRIVRNWSQIANAGEFFICCQSLGDRLGISLKGASKLRRKFCELGILKQTRPYIANRFCARFRWTAGADPKRQQVALISPSPWNGDPGDVRFKKR